MRKTVKRSLGIAREFDADDIVWAYCSEVQKWRKAVIIACERPLDLLALRDSNSEKEAYVHWKGYDRRLDCWIPWEHIKLYNDRETSDDYVYEDIESDDHAGVDAQYLREHQESTKFKTINEIQLGDSYISCWYFSPYPLEVQNTATLHLCEFCLSFFKYEIELSRHAIRCTARHPPGNEVHRHGNLAVWEVDGGLCRAYCENLSYISKLFLDHKTLRHPVNLFLFYILTEIRYDGYHIVGYFSKEKYSRNNVSCILVLPHCQRKGYGKYLINFSYALSLKEECRGTPERPLSDLGKVSYYNYWKQCILTVIDGCSKLTFEALADELGFEVKDIETAFNDDKIIMNDEILNRQWLYMPPEFMDTMKWKLGKPCEPIKFNNLRLVPYEPFMSPFEYNVDY